MVTTITNARARLTQPLFLLAVGLTLVYGLVIVHGSLCAEAGIAPSESVDMLSRLSMSFLVVWWVRQDQVRSQYWPCFDYDTFMSAGWLLLLPHYLLRTRGARGLLIFAAIISMFLFTMLAVGTVLFVARY